MNIAAILAGGKGTRVGTAVPKQFLELNSKMILLRTVDKFLETNLFDEIYISVNEMWLEFTKKTLESYYSRNILKNIFLVNGGNERIFSFINIVDEVKKKYGSNEDIIIISHDAVRPFVTKEIIEDCIEKTKKFGVAMASIQSADTTYSSKKDGFLTSTYNRKELYLGQTPQGCNMKLLYEVLHSYSNEELLKMTGTSQLFINKGIDVKISLGSVNNMKITTLQDIEFSSYILEKE